MFATLIACGWRMGTGLLFVGFACLGWIDMQGWQARADPLAGRHETDVVFTGTSDGRTLRLDDPPGARVALAPMGVVPVGRVTVRGTLSHAQGKRNPGGFDYRGYLARRDVTGQLFVDEVLSHVRSPDVRGRLARAGGQGLGEREAALVAAMTLGVRDGLGDLRDTFAAAGLAHVLALSGLHVGVLILACSTLLRGLGTRRYPLLLAVVAGFVWLVDASPSVVRACAMVAAGLVTQWSGGGRLEPWTALSLAALGTLLWRPAWLFDTSFQLSYLAVIGLLVFTPPLLRMLRADRGPWWRPRTLIGGGIAVSVASQLPLASLLLAGFGQLPLLSPLVNVIAVPLATVLVPLGFLASTVGVVWEPLARLVNVATQPVAWLLIATADWAASWPSLTWGEIDGDDHVVYAVAVVALALHVHARLRLRNAAVVWLLVLGIAAIPPRLPEIVFLDVGQGDAALIRLPGRVEILIDGGGTPFSDFDPGAQIVVPALRALGVDELELVVASHSDTDHIEGLASVLRAIPVQQLIVGVPAPGVRVYDELMVAAMETGTAVRSVRRGERISVGDAELSVLHPAAGSRGESNEDSVALLFSWQGHPVGLFLGDVSTEVERVLAVPATPLLMVAHHGSRFSTSDELLRAARPQRAVVSVGRNMFGHPAAEVLARLEAYGVQVHTTRAAGAVRVSVPDLLQP